LLISNLKASDVAADVIALDGALYAVIPSELPFLPIPCRSIVAEIVSMGVLIQVSSKISRLSA